MSESHDLIREGKTWRCPICGWSPDAWGRQNRRWKMPTCTALTRYEWFNDPHKPASLLTQTQLKEAGLRPGGPPRAYIYWFKKDELYLLYDRAEARAKRTMTEGQAEALAKAQAALRTCQICGTIEDRPIPPERKREKHRLCCTCSALWEREDRRIEIQALRRWAQDRLRQGCVILDTETTGLGLAEIVEIAVIDADGTPLVDTLVRPQWEPEPKAVSLHGLTMDTLQHAPDLDVVLPALSAAITGKTVLVYNVSFDYDILDGCLMRRSIDAKAWLDQATWEDLMEPWSAFVGEMRGYDYRWQRLWGGHRALGDCQAALRCLREMADPKNLYGTRDFWEYAYRADALLLAELDNEIINEEEVL